VVKNKKKYNPTRGKVQVDGAEEEQIYIQEERQKLKIESM
jgi:hypothetical protein